MLNKYISTILLCAVFASCTKNFEDINTDPNRPKEITPGVMLGQLQYRMVNTTINASRNFTHELMQVDAPRSSPSGNGLHRYVVPLDAGIWNSIYGYMNDAEDMLAMANDLQENNYKAIALIYKSWAYSILTDLYGNVPYYQATQAANGVFQASFDDQKTIYEQLLKNLDTANAIINTSAGLRFGGDMVYNAGMLKWKKFANSLKLRLLLRISKRDGEINVNEQINAIISNPDAYPVFSGNADDAIFKYPGTFPYFNPFYNARTLDWREGTYFTKFFVDNMNTWGDPRRSVWATQVTIDDVKQYTGIESGYPTSTEYQVGKNSSYNDGLKTLPQLGVMMTYAEVEFSKAELALKGFVTGKTPQQHYESGIAASMTQWGVSLPDGYLVQPGVAYNNAGTMEQQLEQIMLQKYYAFFFVDYQMWFEKTRTGYPVLPRGAGIPAENSFPFRVRYPGYLQSLNPGNLAKAVSAIGGDEPSTKLWWQK